VTSPLARAAACSAAFLVLALLIATGACTALDQYAANHLMPGLYPYVGGGHSFALGAFGGPLSSTENPHRIINRIADVAYVPAGGAVASALVCICAAAAVAVGRQIADVVGWVLAYGVGNAVELLGKLLVTRPSLHTTALYGSAHVWKFDTSFPSGHAIRAVLLSAFVAWLVRPMSPVAHAWAALVVVLLVVAGTHTPTDVVGGLLVAAALIFVRRDVSHRFLPA
jgi:membrane-associated phospholipid phosphatase